VTTFVRAIPWSTWGTWGEHVGSWIFSRGKNPNFLLVRYEDLKRDPPASLARIAEFMGIAASPERLERALEASSADRMRELEKSQSEQWVATKGKRDDIPFVRGAKAGSWKTALPRSSVIEIESAWGDLMIALGYELSEVEPSTFADSFIGRIIATKSMPAG
jgi:hypothetical protein